VIQRIEEGANAVSISGRVSLEVPFFVGFAA